MAGHSKWANIKHRKAAQDAQRGKIFTKLIRELVTAAKIGGGDVSANPRLRAAVDKALSSNMTRDTINRAIERGVGGGDDTNMETRIYEGYGPGGTAVMVECLSDNANRTISQVRPSFTKCGGNYAGSLDAQVKAEEHGYTQVLWLDGQERKYVEEVGSMNIMFLINDTVVTAPLEGSVLPGVTRDSMLTILRDWGYKVEERHLSVDELMEAGRTGALKEAWGTGTAAVISPVGELCYKGEEVLINDFKTGELTQKLYDTLTGIQWGKLPDKFNWIHKVK